MPPELIQPAAPERIIVEDAMHVAAPHATVVARTAVAFLARIVSAPCDCEQSRCIGGCSRPAHMDLVALDWRIDSPGSVCAPLNSHRALIAGEDGIDWQQT